MTNNSVFLNKVRLFFYTKLKIRIHIRKPPIFTQCLLRYVIGEQARWYRNKGGPNRISGKPITP